MRLSNKAAKIIFSMMAVVLLLLSYLLYQQIRDLLKAQEQLNETNLVKLRLQETLSSLKDAESSQRGFLLTKDSVFLQPYYGAYDRSRSLLDEVRQRTTGSGQQQRDLNMLATLIEVRFRTFNHVIAHYNNPDINEETRKAHLARGQSGMDSIRLYAKRVEEVEDALMLVREKQKENYNFLTPFFGILLMVTAIGILIFSYGKIIEQLNRTSRLLRQLRKLNHKLKNKNHQLEAYNKELDSLTFIASHDLKEPLRKILTYTTMVESAGYGQLPAESQGHFEKIKRAAVRMRNLLNDLLLYSHVNTGDRKYEPIDLNKVVQEVVVNLEDEIAETRAQVNSGSLPVVKGMPFQLKQLFENLISNSLKYRNEEHAPRITIDSDVVNRKEIHEKFAKGHNRYHRVHVRDNGLGFDPSYADKVFKLFHRLHAHTDKPGTGIGLAICKKIIENHQGFIKASSEVNKGTVIEIYLPVN